MVKRMHITDNDNISRQFDACSECFTICNHDDNFCKNCGVEFDTEDAFNKDDLTTPKSGKKIK